MFRDPTDCSIREYHQSTFIGIKLHITYYAVPYIMQAHLTEA